MCHPCGQAWSECVEIYRQSRSKYWYVTVYVDGQRKRKSTKQTKRSAAMEAAMQMMREAAQPEPAPPLVKTIPTIEQFAVEAFLPFLDGCTLDPDTVLYYRNGWRLLKGTLLMTAALPDGTPYRNTLLDQVFFSDVDTLAVPGGPSNMNNMRRTLRRMLSLAVDRKVLTASPRIRLVREVQRTAVYPPELEQKCLAVAKQPLTDIFLLVFDSGVRPDESLHLQWPDMLWDKNLIHIRWGKTALSERYVPMSERVKQMLIGRLKASKSRWVFPSTRKKDAPFGYTVITKRFRALREAVGIPKDLVLYSGRHTFATDLLDSTGNIKLVAETIGHASVETTARYLHPSKKGLADHVNSRNTARAQEGEKAIPADFGHTFGHTTVPVQ